ncbi:Functional role page for Anaerobic nitric oxide reductase transcription regulator NorR [Morganella morganii IS15]|nr:Functional role page for Anaerobic nitric oxide reductase transcription regulator NorR [Morganella morganii IS15]
MGFSVDVLTGIAIALQRDIGHQDRFQRLVSTLRRVLNCDAAALLRYESHQFIPLAIDGLSPDVLGRRFRLMRIPDWKPSPVPGMSSVFPQTVSCLTLMMV